MTEQIFVHAEIYGTNPAGQKLVQINATNADGIRFWTEENSIVRYSDIKPVWISTAERLPEPFHSVLIHAPGESPLPTVSEGYLTTDEIWISLYNEPYAMEEIKHWMPLPAPPDMGEQE